MPEPEFLAADEGDALSPQEATNYARAVEGYRPPADHATQPDQVDSKPAETPEPEADAGEGE